MHFFAAPTDYCHTMQHSAFLHLMIRIAARARASAPVL
jgi:hypothetical protein